MKERVVIFLVLLLVSPVIPRRSSGGGGFNRGSSGARGQAGGAPSGGAIPNSGGFRPQPQPGWNGGSAGGFRPQPPSGGVHPGGGVHPSQPFGGGQSSFRQSGVGSKASSGTWKTALAAGALGAVGGVVAWEAGKAIIHSASTPFNVGGRSYYFGDEHYQNKNGQFMCSIPLSELQSINAATATTTASPSSSSSPTSGNETTTAPSPVQADQVFNNLQFPDGSRPKSITWGCRVGTEVCCGTECCPAPSSGGSTSRGGGANIGSIVLLLILLLLLLSCCGCFIVYKCFGGLFSCLKRDKSTEVYEQRGAEYPLHSYSQPQQAYNPGYPGQPQGYPQQSAYPNYPPQQYPQY